MEQGLIGIDIVFLTEEIALYEPGSPRTYIIANVQIEARVDLPRFGGQFIVLVS